VKRGEIIKIGTKRGILTGCLPAQTFVPPIRDRYACARAEIYVQPRVWTREVDAESENQTTALRRRYAESRIKAGTLRPRVLIDGI
jgi:hypothetical protein